MLDRWRGKASVVTMVMPGLMSTKSCNRVLLLAVVVLFGLNMWLVRTLLSLTSDLQELGAVNTNDLLKKTTKKQSGLKVPYLDSRPQLCATSPLVDRKRALVLGTPKINKDFLTIAIPTVRREQKSYLQQTLDSLIKGTTPRERATITVVIFAANVERALNEKLEAELAGRYRKYFNSGFLQLITAPSFIYPDLSDLKQNFGDSKERVAWRAKQVLDYAFLFGYSESLSQYYLQLEDDVIAAPDFLKSVHNYLEVVRHKRWVTLEFSELGFIGKLVRSSELPRMAQFMLFFYEDQPVDYLQKYYNLLNAQEGSFRHAPSIFQHVGMRSSLANKEQELIDRFFEDNARKYQSDNPPAVLYSSMEAFSMYTPQLAYSAKPGYFWGKTPITGDTFLVVFEDLTRLDRVVIETGSEANPDDFLRSGKLEASPVVVTQSQDATPRCSDYHLLAEFADGKVDVSDLETKLDFETHCLQVTVTKSQQQWLLIREVAVWVPR